MALTPSMLFVNLPVENLQRSIDFFTALGFTFNPDYTDESATCMIINDHAFVMLLQKERFQQFTKKTLADAKTTTEVLVSFSADSREQVDQLVEKALASGGSAAGDVMDLGFMYGWSFQDPDGHIWELAYMEPAGGK